MKSSTFYQKYLPALNSSRIETLSFELPRTLQEAKDYQNNFMRFLQNQQSSLKSLTFYLQNEAEIP
jgi:hypothetical protein